MDDERLEGFLSKVPFDRRQFVKRMLIATAFATPVVASFSMDEVSTNKAAAQAGTSNQV